MNENLAKSISNSIQHFLDCKQREHYSIDLVFPAQLLKPVYEKYPPAFTNALSLADIVSRIECKRLILHRNPSSDYAAFKLNRHFYFEFMTKNHYPKSANGLFTLLLNDNVEDEYVQFRKSKIYLLNTMVKEHCRNERWKLFLGAINPSEQECLDGSNKARIDYTLYSLLEYSDCKELIECVVKYNSRVLISKVVSFACNNMNRPSITLEDFRRQRTHDGTVISRVYSINTAIPDDVYQLLYTASVRIDCIHAIKVIPQVCKHFYHIARSVRYGVLEHAISRFDWAAKRFINDSNQYLPEAITLNIGYPWNLDTLNESMSLYVLAMTAHSKAFTMGKLYKDYIRGFTELKRDIEVEKSAFKHSHHLLGYILSKHKFQSLPQYHEFTKRAMQLTHEPIRLLPNPFIDGVDLYQNIISMVEIHRVTDKLYICPEWIEAVLGSNRVDKKAFLENILTRFYTSTPSYHAYAVFKHLFGPGWPFIDTLETIAKCAYAQPILDLKQDDSLVIQFLLKHKSQLGMFEGKKDIQFLINATIDGRLEKALVDDTVLEKMVTFFCEYRLPVHQFNSLLQALDPNTDKLCRLLLNYALNNN